MKVYLKDENNNYAYPITEWSLVLDAPKLYQISNGTNTIRIKCLKNVTIANYSDLVSVMTNLQYEYIQCLKVHSSSSSIQADYYSPCVTCGASAQYILFYYVDFGEEEAGGSFNFLPNETYTITEV